MASDPIERLISGLSRLPGIGPKSARRLALEILTWEMDEVRSLAELLIEVKTVIRRCSTCFNLTEIDPCTICSDPRRDGSQVMVVDYLGDLLALENSRRQTGIYSGLYHVLDGRISPLDGVGPEDLNLQSFFDRIEGGGVQEVILANGPTVEGDATAQYIRAELEGTDVRVTRIALGVPVGSDLALADQVTLARALEGRREF